MRRALLGLFGSLLAVCTFACSKSDPPGAQGSAPAASAELAQLSAAPSASAAPAAAVARMFKGSYDAKASELHLPDTPAMKKVKWRGDEATDGLGAGELSLTIEPDGRVHGESTGALGAMLIEGHTEGDKLGASLLRKTPTDLGFTGTLEATTKDGTLEGVLHVTGYNASVLREASFKLTAK